MSAQGNLTILRELCGTPTAPFVEDRVIQYVEQFAQARPRLRLRRDAFGNRLLELRGAPARGPRLVFVAHMDHPGLAARKMVDPKTLQADFRGGVHADYVRGARVRFFEGDREIAGTVKTCEVKTPSPVPHRCTVSVSRIVSANAPGMFDLTPGRISGRKFHARVCDDLAGAAAALTVLDTLARKPPRATVALLLTRAEEVGFVGAIAAATRSSLLRKSDRMISIECSSAQPFAPQGAGVILRVGDRTSIFNSDFTYFLNEQAQALAKRDKSFTFQRALMPGGSCEGTVFDAYGYVTGAVCVPLGNYHNMDRAKRKIAPEFIDLGDWRSMVKLFEQVARHGHEFKPGFGSLRSRLEARFRKYEPLLLRSSAPSPSGRGSG